MYSALICSSTPWNASIISFENLWLVQYFWQQAPEVRYWQGRAKYIFQGAGSFKKSLSPTGVRGVGLSEGLDEVIQARPSPSI
ncbi:MAG: hypothetical protein HUK40_04905 [Desulfobacter sp.]|nr:hypothetical protein [Desulfobacter sp.]